MAEELLIRAQGPRSRQQPEWDPGRTNHRIWYHLLLFLAQKAEVVVVGSSESLEEAVLVDGESTAPLVYREEPILGSSASSGEAERAHDANVSSSASLVECEMGRILSMAFLEE